jgi:site-specific DNA-methyltransferase (adenine-specific)
MKVESIVHNKNCMEDLINYPDNYFDLAIVDPPYQIGLNSSTYNGSGKLKNRVLNQSAKKFEAWDLKPPPEYFEQLFRVSKNQIIWGGNYFELPPTRCVIAWDKMQPFPNFSQIEMAWTSFDKPAKLFKYDNRTGGKIHPTQKPIELYAFCLNNFAKEGDIILDTHLGSGSSRIACHLHNYTFVGYEIDKEYFDLQNQRFKPYFNQQQFQF